VAVDAAHAFARGHRRERCEPVARRSARHLTLSQNYSSV
jgi:hypothetical protein